MNEWCDDVNDVVMIAYDTKVVHVLVYVMSCVSKGKKYQIKSTYTYYRINMS